MLTDCQILGIDETTDVSIIKSAFRKRVKDIHPDHSTEDDAFRNHILFIQVNQAYSRLMDKPRAPESVTHHNPQGNGGNKAVVRSKDPAYAFYKTGVKYFMHIHPSKWNTEGQLQTPIKGDRVAEQENLRQTVTELAKLFPKAYWYFSIVVNEYPESMWSGDAREKMSIIEERTRRYRKIIESFGLAKEREFKPELKIKFD